MDEIEVETVVYLPPDEVFEFLLDFPGYARYSEYLKEVRTNGTGGGEGARYDMVLSWWKLSYVAHSKVTDVERPERIDWKLLKDVDARGCWRVEEAPEEAPEDAETATRILLQAEYNLNSVDSSALDLPRFVSLDWVLDKVKPKVKSEAETVVGRIVADLEGEPRDVDVDIRT